MSCMPHKLNMQSSLAVTAAVIHFTRLTVTLSNTVAQNSNNTCMLAPGLRLRLFGLLVLNHDLHTCHEFVLTIRQKTYFCT